MTSAGDASPAQLCHPAQLSAITPPSSPWATPDVVPIASTRGFVTRDPRIVVLRRNHDGFGFNIVGGENGEGIFVSFVLAGGSADRSGQLLRGDQLLSVNGADLSTATHEQAASALKRSGNKVELLVAHRPEDYNQFEAHIQDLREQMLTGGGALRTTQKRSLYVRAQFDYDPSKDAGLPNRGIAFRKGDILHVTNASDDEWWQARRVDGGLQQEQGGGFGIIPSRRRVERRERAKMRKVNFNRQAPVAAEPEQTRMGTLEKKKKSSLLRRLHLSRGSRDLAQADDAASGDLDSTVGAAADVAIRIPSYEVVHQTESHLVRPIIILGPLKDHLNDALVNGCPDRFVSCVPHTTRAPRPNEVEGRDYFFVSSREKMEKDIANQLFIEAGQYNGNLYGTAVDTVRRVAESNLHCVLDVSGNAIKRLEAAELYPITVFVRPHSVENIRNLKRDMTEDQARKMLDRARKVEAEYGALFTATVSGNSAEEIVEKTKRAIAQHADKIVWVASRDEEI